MEFLTADWLGTPVWFWLAFIGIVIALTVFDLGILHKEDREMGIAESLKLSVFYIAIAMAFGVWVWMEKGGRRINAKSIMGVMMLAAEFGSTITLRATGADAEAALEALAALAAIEYATGTPPLAHGETTP